MTDTLLTQDGRSVLRLERSFGARVETVWGALINPARLSQWYPATVQMQASLGGRIELDYGGGVTTDGVITAFDGPQVFAFSEAGTGPDGELLEGQVRFELHPEVGGSLLVFRQTFADRSAAARFAAGWQVCFDSLDLLLRGQPVTRAPVSPESVARYATRFDLEG